MNFRPNRKLILGLLAASLVASGLARAGANEVFDEALEVSLKEKKGVVVHVNGQAISGRVTKLGTEAIELTSREFVRIVIRRDRIDAVSGN